MEIKTMNQWTTEICAYQGNVYRREVSPTDTTVYADYIYASVPYITTAHGYPPNEDMVKREIRFAEDVEMYGEVRNDYFK